jgi:DNA-binding CsgD family transcriptional regulator
MPSKWNRTACPFICPLCFGNENTRLQAGRPGRVLIVGGVIGHVLLFATLYNIPFAWYLLILLVGFILPRDVDDSNRKRGTRIFCLLALAGFAITWSLSRSWAGYETNPHPSQIFLYFSLNLPSLVYLRHHLMRSPPEPASIPLMQDTDLEGFYEKFGLSNREREIVRLMLTGKSNKEIAEELFVSTHTIKNHVYNIYQKLRVTNRLHFIRTIQNNLQKKAD